MRRFERLHLRSWRRPRRWSARPAFSAAPPALQSSPRRRPKPLRRVAGTISSGSFGFSPHHRDVDESDGVAELCVAARVKRAVEASLSARAHPTTRGARRARALCEANASPREARVIRNRRDSRGSRSRARAARIPPCSPPPHATFIITFSAAFASGLMSIITSVRGAPAAHHERGESRALGVRPSGAFDLERDEPNHRRAGRGRGRRRRAREGPASPRSARRTARRRRRGRDRARRFGRSLRREDPRDRVLVLRLLLGHGRCLVRRGRRRWRRFFRFGKYRPRLWWPVRFESLFALYHCHQFKPEPASGGRACSASRSAAGSSPRDQLS